jgi:hypothetical protein
VSSLLVVVVSFSKREGFFLFLLFFPSFILAILM